MDNKHFDAYVSTLTNDLQLVSKSLTLSLGLLNIRVQSNNELLLAKLTNYFAQCIADPRTLDLAQNAIDLIAIDCEDLALDLVFKDWVRENGKQGRKDSYYDFHGARIIRKVRTGMVFFQSTNTHIAAGRCLENDNQVINFINAQYMCHLQQADWVTCHAAGVVHNNGAALAMAGFSGGGKSTLMLRLMEDPEVSYLTNDRLFIKQDKQQTHAAGIPKLPRINPGTILHNPRLHPIMTPERLAQIGTMEVPQLWDLEEKYDVLIGDIYGQNRIKQTAQLSGIIILNWQRTGNEALQIQPVAIKDRPDLLPAIMKSPGPFYQLKSGSFYRDSTPLDSSTYLKAFGNTPVYEVKGAVDFDQLSQHCLALLLGRAS